MPKENLHVATLENAPAYSFLNALHIVLASSVSQAGAYALVHLTAPPGFTTPYHLHHTEDEAFYLLEGAITAFYDGKRMELEAGAYVFLPRGVPHGFRCSGDKTARLLIHVIPGGSVGFMGMMLEMAIPVHGGIMPQPTPPDLARLSELCQKNQIEILGPLPA